MLLAANLGDNMSATPLEKRPHSLGVGHNASAFTATAAAGPEWLPPMLRGGGLRFRRPPPDISSLTLVRRALR
jgi:hypothetical protein